LSDNLRPDGRRTRPAAALALRRAKQKIFPFIFWRALSVFNFSFKEEKFFPPHAALRAAEQAGKNSFPPDPLFFLPAC